MQLNNEEIKNLDRKYRLHLINSITGIKPANLVGTKSKDGLHENVAIFSSVVHLGSDPALIGFIVRPQTDGFRDTYRNIIETKIYTLNHITSGFIKKAHYTSAKLDKDISEFELMNLKSHYLDGFDAPFVEESPVKIGMSLVEAITLPNQCIMIIGNIEHLVVPDQSLDAQGQIDLSNYNNVGISGLNRYYALNKIAEFPYVRKNEIPNFENE